MSLLAIAQDVVQRTDNFDDGASIFGFEPYANRKQNVTFDGGYLVLSSKKNECFAFSRLPINVRHNFKVTYKLIVPKLDSDTYANIIFNFVEDEENISKSEYDAIVITEGKIAVVSQGSIISKHKIKLKKGKQVPITIVVEKKGNRVFMTVNGVDFEEPDIRFRNSMFGFMVIEKQSLKVDEITVYQRIVED